MPNGLPQSAIDAFGQTVADDFYDWIIRHSAAPDERTPQERRDVQRSRRVREQAAFEAESEAAGTLYNALPQSFVERFGVEVTDDIYDCFAANDWIRDLRSPEERRRVQRRRQAREASNDHAENGSANTGSGEGERA